MKPIFNSSDRRMPQGQSARAEDESRQCNFETTADRERSAAHAQSALEDEMLACEWREFAARLQRQPDGSFINPIGIDNAILDNALRLIRDERRDWQPRNPFEDAAAFVDEPGDP